MPEMPCESLRDLMTISNQLMYWHFYQSTKSQSANKPLIANDRSYQQNCLALFFLS